ncbi:DUF29 domain-containing protein [Anabaena cylindrica FACHB-243]|uniref:DUF29 domain-containing protein n=1 Tax=Anabaena cylindrica (strain ATCC 27899 / PCC 7122) TaxID=272123 RepID=K9ZIE3_ANACC|nr:MULTISPECIES: DUF29 domain-containing protein [Anabaena]AFZ58110.1 protein of unknown function DUF29 [Anabaena cylindrica PCC 7122]MBD2419115.1 DUF29 domain-containing protein [Anabaena cylindrica FACHB-243]MBY5280676.1 DUF29 domain-containing protein [Anabaena sp. CCAP 1446/1C]MBY5310586.1 DUF29 domain-containing protein [Anabaena sp. CCAP 1446/1C]MCM2409585.1 DUF29 domain-containing protein [Anabaena sp. CCAP 1446/1C]
MTTHQPTVTTNANLYEQDFYLWIETTAKQLKAGKLAEVDLENLIEEIESMGRSEKRALESNLVVLLMHLLKYKYQPEKRTNSWLSTILEHRRRLNKNLQDSPSLKKYFLETFSECYQDARQQAAIETGLLIDNFPVESPFSADECLNKDFLPD